jgi:VIT1/CCC1 family predicted Fe2+/Mn2+ transporter
MNPKLKSRLVSAQANEITEHHIYGALARRETNPANRKVLERISADEKRHYLILSKVTGQEAGIRRVRLHFYLVLARLLGMTFALKLMEAGEDLATGGYAGLARQFKAARGMSRNEHTHERFLLGMLDEERLRYVSSVVLGLSDALVEFTGALAGFAFAFQKNKLVVLTGLITGIAAALSMAASEYLSTRADKGGHKHPLKAATYTGLTYLATVFLLVAPFMLLASPPLAVALCLGLAVAEIWAFSYYISVAQEKPFWPHFLEMAGLSLGVAAISFGIGLLVRAVLGVNV